MEMRKLSADQPIFLAGVYRSGTTLLRLMLNAHSRISIPVESHFLSDLIYSYPTENELSVAQVQSVEQSIANHPRFEHWQTTPHELNQALKQTNHPTLANLIDTLFKLETGHEKPRWGDKTPGYERHFDQLAKVFPHAKFIHIHRDGRDVSSSMCDRNWHGITEFQRARYWRRSMESAFATARRLGRERCLNVAYESLVRDPHHKLKQICAFLGESYEATMLEFTHEASEHVVDQAIHAKLIRLPNPETDLERWKRESGPLRVLLFEALQTNICQQQGMN